MRLSSRERKVLLACELQAKRSVKEISKITGLRSHTVTYILQKMKRLGVAKKCVYIDPYPMGVKDYAFYFSLSSESNDQQEKIIHFLCESDKVSWLAGLGGDFQFGAAIYVNNIQELLSFLDELSLKFGQVFSRKSVTLRAEFIRFSRDYLCPEMNLKQPDVSFGREGGIHLDILDKNILSSLANTSKSPQEIASQNSVSLASVYSRVKKLENSNIIKAYIHSIDSAKFGMYGYELLLHTKGIGSSLREKILTIAKKHPNIIYFVHTIGEWDYELGIELSSPEDINSITRMLYAELGNDLNLVSVLPLFSLYKESYYPFLHSLE